MDVVFKNNRLKRCYERQQEGVKKWGPKIARVYVDRVNRLYAVRTAHELSAFPELRFHPLEGDRKGEWAMDLDEYWRLIVTFQDRNMTVVRVKEVSDHYGD